MFSPSLFQRETILHTVQTRLKLLTWGWHTEHQTRLCKPQNTTQTGCFTQKLQKHVVIRLIYTLKYKVWTRFVSGCASPANVYDSKTWPKASISMEAYFVEFKLMYMYSHNTENTVLSCCSFGFLKRLILWMLRKGGHGRLGHVPCWLPQRLLSTWSSTGLGHMLKSLVHLPRFVSTLISYQTLKWVQLVIVLLLSPSLLYCSPLSKKPSVLSSTVK